MQNFVEQVEALIDPSTSGRTQEHLDRQAFAETAAFMANYERFPDPATNLAVMVMSKTVSSRLVIVTTINDDLDSGEMLNLGIFPEGRGPICALNVSRGYLESVAENPILQIARTAKIAESTRLLFQNYFGFTDRSIMHARQAAIAAGATNMAISMAVKEGQVYGEISHDQKVGMVQYPNGMASLEQDNCNAGISVGMAKGCIDKVEDPSMELLGVVAELDFISMTSNDTNQILSHAAEAIKAGIVSDFSELEYYLRLISSQLFFQAVPKTNQGPKYVPIIPGTEDIAEYGINVSQSVVGRRESPNQLLMEMGDTYQVNFGKLARAGLFTMLPKYRQAEFN